MLTFQSEVTVEGLTGHDVTAFLLRPDDDSYRAWWPGTHLAFHVLKRGPRGSHVGDVVLMDEYVGTRRLRMRAEVVEAVPGERVVWHLLPWRLRLPARLALDLHDDADSVVVRHTVTAGWSGRGRLFDPLWRLYFSRSFVQALDRHVRTEFPLLRTMRDAAAHPGSRHVGR